MNRIALVTGASRLKGIGAATCRSLADSGIDVFFTYWTAYDRQMEWGIHNDEPALLQAELMDKGVRCERMEMDLSDTSNLNLLLRQVEDSLGYPDILINNACYSTNDSYATIEEESLDLHYAINVRAVTLLTSYFARGFKKGKGGRVISLTSGQSLESMRNELSYAITKGTVEHLTKTLVPDLAEKGITINAVNPGPNDTGWMDADLKEALLPKFPMGRLGTPEDVGRLIRFLAGEEAEWITGQIIHSEGGFQRA
ncbi:SDR family oxidoreductase [Pseudalkalibacillus salsuginis]|uniref:SDR family oxidoreductase n=1 Tax=Pseudalkalibacillus salsuginis TaxID=2910972 RepID=UPI001EEC0C16|nr:SDR family oxidoreductase [Pseudalkalibacillus salsuginis]MCF6411189.1 SDR family oxidoreductase [Pseudalkalibacillus salsuginis]